MDTTKTDAFRKKIMNPFNFKLFMLSKLPMGYISGLKIEKLDHEKAIVSIPYKYLNINPFKSMYFACQLMAGEMSTGVLAMQFVTTASVPVSMLVTDIKASFHKKATERIYFKCTEGEKIKKAIENTIESGEGVSIIIESIATTASGELITTFNVEWSFKRKTKV